jgi:hypothetical protein
MSDRIAIFLDRLAFGLRRAVSFSLSGWALLMAALGCLYILLRLYAFSS